LSRGPFIGNEIHQRLTAVSARCSRRFSFLFHHQCAGWPAEHSAQQAAAQSLENGEAISERHSQWMQTPLPGTTLSSRYPATSTMPKACTSDGHLETAKGPPVPITENASISLSLNTAWMSDFGLTPLAAKRKESRRNVTVRLTIFLPPAKTPPMFEEFFFRYLEGPDAKQDEYDNRRKSYQTLPAMSVAAADSSPCWRSALASGFLIKRAKRARAVHVPLNRMQVTQQIAERGDLDHKTERDAQDTSGQLARSFVTLSEICANGSFSANCAATSPST